MKKWFNRTFAPYTVCILPSDAHAEQYLYTWSWSEAAEWIGCALRTDYVYVLTRSRTIIATRFPTVEVTYG